jgi:SAM-dependent MidA family methyltransferase
MSQHEQGRPELIALIADEIRERGPMTFARFMELALYHPQFGYYMTGEARIGRAGDFYTSVSVGPLFGKLLARQFRQFRAALGNPTEFEVVEFGGHRGQLRADVLAAAPELPYRIVEVGDPLPDSMTGCVFSNEFLDALPVHRVCVHNGEWKEIYVAIRQSDVTASTECGSTMRVVKKNLKDHTAPDSSAPRFTETMGALSTPRLAEQLRDLPVRLMEGYRTEVNLRALDWLDDVSHRLTRGFVLTIDYGHEQDAYYAPQRRDGTLLCHYKHTRNNEPLDRVGLQDITSHVNFTSLIKESRKHGLESSELTDQSHFLLAVGKDEIAEIVERDAGKPSKERATIHQLIHPELMGRAFKVFIQHKGVLPPLRFDREPV